MINTVLQNKIFETVINKEAHLTSVSLSQSPSHVVLAVNGQEQYIQVHTGRSAEIPYKNSCLFDVYIRLNV
jgi:hypothetical protein